MKIVVTEWTIDTDEHLVIELKQLLEMGSIMPDGRFLLEEQVIGMIGGLNTNIFQITSA